MKKARVSFFESEIYSCPCSDNEYKREEVEGSWLCPSCNEHIYIYASSSEERGVFLRKKGSEIVAGDLVRPDGFGVNENYEVLGVKELTTKADKGKVGLGLKQYRQIAVNPDDYIACRIGGW